MLLHPTKEFNASIPVFWGGRNKNVLCISFWMPHDFKVKTPSWASGLVAQIGKGKYTNEPMAPDFEKLWAIS